MRTGTWEGSSTSFSTCERVKKAALGAPVNWTAAANQPWRAPDGATPYAVHPYGSLINAYESADGFLHQGGWDYGSYDLSDRELIVQTSVGG